MQLRSFSVITCQKWPILSYIQQIGLLIQKIFTVPCKSSSARYLTGNLFKIAEMLLSYLTWKTHKNAILFWRETKQIKQQIDIPEKQQTTPALFF